MGNGAGTTSQTTPKKVNFASGVIPIGINTGHWHTCVVSQTYEMYCWGDGVYGKLGDGANTHNPTPGKVNHFSGTNPVKAHGEITSWAIHPALPTGLSFGSTNGTLYGRPTASLAQTNFTTRGRITPRFTLHRSSSIKQLETVRCGKFMATTTVWTDFLEI